MRNVSKQRRPAREIGVAEAAGDQHGEPDRHADGDEQQHRHEPQGRHGKSAHARPRHMATAVPTKVTVAAGISRNARRA